MATVLDVDRSDVLIVDDIEVVGEYVMKFEEGCLLPLPLLEMMNVRVCIVLEV